MLTYAASALALAGTTLAASGTAGVTPHEQYSSSVGVLGCLIDTNRVAYWPMSIDCNNVCVKLTYQNRTTYVLRIDQSGGAYDISYDAWNWLYTGFDATDKPAQGGAVSMSWEDVDASNCADLLHTSGSKLPLSGSNSMNYLASCLNDPNSWVAQNYVLYNIVDPVCHYGYDETCTLDWPSQNQATCPHQLGVTAPLTDMPVYNIAYGTGQTYVA